MSINKITPTLTTFIGNEPIITQIKNNIKITKLKQSSYPHTLIFSGSGMGKTTLAHAIAQALNVKLYEINCASNPQITNTLMKAPNNSIILLDEIHALAKHLMEDQLYRYMDEGIITLRYPDGDIETFKIPTNLTIIGCTNEVDKLPQPLFNRFTAQHKLKNYTHDEMCGILKLNLSKSLDITSEAYTILANATRYIPRMAVQYSTQIINYAMLNDLTKMNDSDVISALQSIGIDEHGLTDDDHEYITLINDTFNGGPVGLKQLCAMLNDSESSIIARENYLVKEGYVVRSSKGRVLKAKGRMVALKA